jgi:hypothetical protein
MDNGLAGQQSIGQTAGKVPWFRRDDPPPLLYIFLPISCLMVLAKFIGAWRVNQGLGLDDGWIHLTFARNLAQHHLWSINPEGLSGGSTSILWVLVLSIGFFITDNGPAVALIANFILIMMLSLLTYRLWIDQTMSSDQKHLTTLLTIACGNLLWYAFTGMETLLVLVLGLAAISCTTKEKNIWAMIFVFLGVLTRPDCVLIVPAIILLKWRQWRVCVQLIFAACMGLLITALWNHHLTGTFLPSTLSGRRWIIGASDAMVLNPLEILKNFFRLIGVWGYRLTEFTFAPIWLSAMGLPLLVCRIIAMIQMFVVLIGMIACLKKKSFQINALIIWSIYVLLGYAIMLPSRGHGGRYQPMVLFTIMIFFIMGLVWLWNFFSKHHIWRIGVIILGISYLYSIMTWTIILYGSLQQFDQVHVAAGKWIDENTPKNARVAGFDIGALAYWGHRHIIDLGGLVDPAAGRALYDHTIPEYLNNQKADYLVMVFPYTDPNVYFKDLGLDQLERAGILRQVEIFTFPIENKNFYLPGEAARVLANEIRIYRIVWNEKRNKI